MVKAIIRYLKRTMNLGKFVKQTSILDLTCFIDADFTGLFKCGPNESITSAKFQTGNLIKLSGCPLKAKSQLQPTIALAEHYVLSCAMMVISPMKAIIEEMLTKVNNQPKATVHEDNTSAPN